jgi:hypothetical protein
MKVTLVKLSSPGWSKEFWSRKAAAEKLRGCVCVNCRKVDLNALLGTACGADYMIKKGWSDGEEVGEHPEKSRQICT